MHRKGDDLKDSHHKRLKEMSFQIFHRFRGLRPVINLNNFNNDWMGMDILNASRNPYPYGVKVYAHNGNDNIIGSKKGDALSGMNGRDSLWGDVGSDYIYGGADSDLCDGGRGNDYIDGGRGVDKYIGGPGRDTFMIKEHSRGGDKRWQGIWVDTITDFQDVGDRIKLGRSIGDFNVTINRGNCYSTDGSFCTNIGGIPYQRYIEISDSDGVSVAHALLPSDRLFDIAVDSDRRTVQIVGSLSGQGLDPIQSNLQYI